jgi:hypothetical protein
MKPVNEMNPKQATPSEARKDAKQTFTPGPWEAGDYDHLQGSFVKKAGDTVPLANLPGYNLPNFCKEQESNARLIAAAPELLETVKILRDRLAESLGLKANGEINLADRIIAKATGGK